MEKSPLRLPDPAMVALTSARMTLPLAKENHAPKRQAVLDLIFIALGVL